MINGLIVYERADDGVLSGKWTQMSDQKRTDILLGSERAVPQASHAAFEGSYDVTICDTSGAVIYEGTLRLDLVAMSIVADWTPDEKWADRGTFQGIGIADEKRRLSLAYWSVESSNTGSLRSRSKG